MPRTADPHRSHVPPHVRLLAFLAALAALAALLGGSLARADEAAEPPAVAKPPASSRFT